MLACVFASHKQRSIDRSNIRARNQRIFCQGMDGKENFPKLRFQYFLERAKVMRRINLLLRTNKVNIIVANFFLGNNFCENVDQAVSKRTVIWKLQCLACILNYCSYSLIWNVKTYCRLSSKNQLMITNTTLVLLVDQHLHQI